MATQTIEIRAVDKTQATLGKVNRSLGNIDKKSRDIGISFGHIDNIYSAFSASFFVFNSKVKPLKVSCSVSIRS